MKSSHYILFFVIMNVLEWLLMSLIRALVTILVKYIGLSASTVKVLKQNADTHGQLFKRYPMRLPYILVPLGNFCAFHNL